LDALTLLKGINNNYISEISIKTFSHIHTDYPTQMSNYQQLSYQIIMFCDRQILKIIYCQPLDKKIVPPDHRAAHLLSHLPLPLLSRNGCSTASPPSMFSLSS
jgi:hypothetical protein